MTSPTTTQAGPVGVGGEAKDAAKIVRTSPAHYFVASPRAITDSLFRPINGVTASGYFKKTATGVRFYTPAGEPFAFLVANRHGERFFVSCCKGEDGRVRYMFSTTRLDEIRLGIADMTLSAESDLAESIWKQLA